MTQFHLGIIIPDRGDRPEFINQCLRLIQEQTVCSRSDFKITIELVNDRPLSGKPDITWRYKLGYHRLLNVGCDLISFWENDDWYAPDYLEYMINEWLKAGKPSLFGTSYTIYYHLLIRKYFKMEHWQRASAMNTFIKPDMDVPWPAESESFTDVALWERIQSRFIFEPSHIIAIGMKHGIGKCGGNSHRDRLYRYINEDNGFLRNTVDKKSIGFYEDLHARLINVK